MFDPDEAMRPGAPVLHDYAPDNVTKHIPIRVGDVEKGFAESDLVVEETYSTQPIEHAYLEPEAGLAYVDHDGVVTIVSPDQNITHHRHMLARIIAKPITKVRFIMSPVGGGFGGKEDMIYQGMLALLAMKTQRPVRLVFTREESIISTAKRHPSRTILRMGLMRDGRIRALEMKMICDGGAYGLSTEGVMRKAAILAAGPYVIPNVKVDTYRDLHEQYAVRRLSLLRRVADGIRHRISPRYLRRAARSRPVRDPPHQCDARRRTDSYQGQTRLGQPDARARCAGKGLRLGSRCAGLSRRTRGAISTATTSGRLAHSARVSWRGAKQEAAE